MISARTVVHKKQNSPVSATNYTGGLALLCPALDQLPTAFGRTKLAKLIFIK